MNIVDKLVETKLCVSKSEARRAIQQGAVFVDDQRVSDIDLMLDDEKVEKIRVGKKQTWENEKRTRTQIYNLNLGDYFLFESELYLIVGGHLDNQVVLHMKSCAYDSFSGDTLVAPVKVEFRIVGNMQVSDEHKES